MWQRFTERARKTVFYAQEEAGECGENYVKTEHMLLGLIRENDSVAARILDRSGVSLDDLRAKVQQNLTRGDGRLGQDMQLTPGAKHVIDLAYEEASNLNNNYIGTEHLLLGLIRDPDGVAGKVLREAGISLERTRREIQSLQEGGDNPHQQNPSTPRPRKTPVDQTAQSSLITLVTKLLEDQKRLEAKVDRLLKKQEGRRKGGKDLDKES